MSNQADAVKSAITMSLKVVKTYEWLLDLYVLDFFVDDHWDKLPETWQKSLSNIDPKDIGDILSGNNTKHVLPLSLLALLKAINSLMIPRRGPLPCYVNNSGSEFHCNHQMQENIFMRHVKLKKRHEICEMSKIVSITANKSQCNSVLDFGSGLGHLVRILSYKYSLNTVGIEMQAQLSDEARILDSEFEYTARKYLTEDENAQLIKPTHYTLKLSSIEQLQGILLPSNITNYGLIGLHPCGDLGPLLIKHFVSCDKVKFICIVGCCYMKLTCDKEPYGYPMSEYVKGLDSCLSYTAREISCHAIESYCQRLCKGEYNYLKVHAYRAALEKLLVQLDPTLKHMPVRSVKHTNDMTFDSYCEAALKRWPVKPPRLQSMAAELSQWRRVVVLYTLRLALAPLVETVVLLDRLLYMLENGISCAIYPVFDPNISPRNHIIVGRKL